MIEDHGRAPFGDLTAHELQDLRLHGHIQRRSRLVGDDQSRSGQQSDRDHDPLTHAAGKLVRIGVEPTFRLGNPNVLQHADATSSPGRLVEIRVELKHLVHLAPDGVDRIERRHRVLEHHGNLAAAHRAQLILALLGKILTVEKDIARFDPAGRVDQPQDREADHRLAATGFADKADDLALVDVEADAVDGLHQTTERVKMRFQSTDIEQRFTHRASLFMIYRRRGLSSSRRKSPNRLMPKTRNMMNSPGNADVHQNSGKQNVESFLHQKSQGRLGDRNSDAEETQRSFDEDEGAYLDGGDDDERGHHVGQDMTHDDLQIAEPSHPRRLDVFLLNFAQGGPADRTRIDHPSDRRQGDQDHDDSGAESRHEEQCDEHRWKRELNVCDAHDDAVDSAAVVTRQQSQRRADRAGQCHRGETDEGGDAGAVDDRGQNISALAVRPEKVAAVSALQPGRRLEAVHQLELRDVVGVLAPREMGRTRP